MDHVGVITLLYLAGAVLLVAEIFIPSHGLLTIAALSCMGVAVYLTFARSTTGGIIGTVCCLVAVPTVLLLGIKYVQHLPMGDRLAPPNPTAADVGPAFPPQETAVLVGKTGKAVTPLHPIGVCDFDGRRVQCVAESGMIEAGTHVIGVGMHLNNLTVRPHPRASA